MTLRNYSQLEKNFFYNFIFNFMKIKNGIGNGFMRINTAATTGYEKISTESGKARLLYYGKSACRSKAGARIFANLRAKFGNERR